MYQLEDLIKAYQTYVQNQPQQPSSAAQSGAMDTLQAGQKPTQQPGMSGGSNAFTPQGFYSAPNAQGGTTLGQLMGGAGSSAAGASAGGAGATEGAGAAGALGV